MGFLAVMFLWSADNFISRSIAKSAFENPVVPLDAFAAPLIFTMLEIPVMIGIAVYVAFGPGRRAKAAAISSIAAGIVAFFFIGMMILQYAAYGHEKPRCGIGHSLENGMCVYDPAAIEDCYGVFCPWIIPIDPPEKRPEYASDCLIATASFGSEFSPHVQMLREVRDNILLSTHSGALFMRGFNSIYYSFSPAIAQAEYENPAFRDAVRAFITPMVAVLSIMTLAEEGSEIHVVTLGVSAISAIAGIYVAGPAVIIWRMLRRRSSKAGLAAAPVSS